MSKFIVIFLLLLFLPKNTYAGENQFINLVNPVRISPNNTYPKSSIQSQYEVLHNKNLPATWLLTFDALNTSDIVEIVKQMDPDNETGIFLEVTETFANAAGILYNKTDSWHRANSILTTGYSQSDRIKLIDTVFEKFKSKFGDYPTSVGAWWIDSYSLGYMIKKYGITANLTVADQFSTDGYGVWGQYFSTPFYPSKLHAGIPASTSLSKLDIVTMQWAPRDPLNSLGISEESLFSTQDYQLIGLPNSYFEKLIDLYSQKHRNSFGQIVLGLEADLNVETYKGLFSRQMDIVEGLKKQGKVKVSTMREFSIWYRSKFHEISPPHIIETDDLLGKNQKVIWYQSPKYRIGLKLHTGDNKILIFDLRTFHSNFQEPYYLSPNKELNLYIRNPSVVDTVQNPNTLWVIETGGTINLDGSPEKFTVTFPKGTLVLLPGFITISKGISPPNIFVNSGLLKKTHSINENQYEVISDWPYPKEGLTFKSLPPEFWYFTNLENLKKPQNIKRVGIGLILFFILLIVIWVKRLYRERIFRIVGLVTIFSGLLLLIINLETYYVSQAELDTLLQLKFQPQGKVIVYNQDCVKCSYTTEFRPAVFANRRDYVRQVSGKEIIYDRSIFTAEDRQAGKKELDRLKARYIYVVSYEGYKELVPFSPGDYNLEMVYENANSQLWKIRTYY